MMWRVQPSVAEGASVDANGIALASIQALYELVLEQKRLLGQVQAEREQQDERIQTLLQRLEAVEAGAF